MDSIPTADDADFVCTISYDNSTTRSESRKKERPTIPKPPTAKEVIMTLLGTKADACITWAENNNILLIRQGTLEECQKEAEKIIAKWETATAARLLWEARIPTEIPQLETDDQVTIRQLHEHLTKLLDLHPDVGDVVVEHEECCGWYEVCEAIFDVEKNVLRIS
jgi:hypothetical protein